MSESDEDPRRRTQRSTAERLQLLEEDGQNHARIIGDLLKKSSTFSPEQMTQIRTVVREEVSDVGLRLDDPDHVDASREDFRFLRRLRLNWDGASRKVGNTVLIAFVGVLLSIAGLGFWAWIGRGGGHP